MRHLVVVWNKPLLTEPDIFGLARYQDVVLNRARFLTLWLDNGSDGSILEVVNPINELPAEK
jgi:hypothetical protein